MLPALDLTTSFLSNAIITGVTAVMLGFIRHANRDLRGLGYWLLGQAASSMGFLWLYGVITQPNPYLGIVGFLCVFAGSILGMLGHHRFLERQGRIGGWAALFFALFCIAMGVLMVAEVKMGFYRVLMLGAQVGPAVASAWMLLRYGRGEARMAYRTVAGLYLLWAAICTLRLTYVATTGFDDDATGWTMGPAIAIATLVLTCHALGLAWMIVGRLQESLVRQAATDPLTGAMNRRALQTLLEQETARAAREGHGLVVATFDLDHFKHLNDTHGHAVGDATLIGVVELAGRMLRPGDAVARLGGEEFCLVLAGLDGKDAAAIVERLRHAVANLDIPGPNGSVQVAASFGIACFGPHGQDWPALLKAADNALYRAKRNGRNRVEFADPTAHEGHARRAGD